ncbi:MAG: hypothetical protein Q4D41_11935 [Prevotellaceae bacterium]|nr:hypothetical protein [Prevotellaceae bacterium]
MTSNNPEYYHRLPQKIKTSLFPLCMDDSLFRVIYRPAADVETRSCISPIEAWCEALSVMKRLGSSIKPEVEILQLCREYSAKYMFIADDASKTVIRRTESMAAFTVCEVLTLVAYMLAAMPSESRLVRNKQLRHELGKKLNAHTLFAKMRNAISNEERIEEAKGNHIRATDYRCVTLGIDFGSEKPKIDVGDIVRIALETNDVGTISSILDILRRFNENGGYNYKEEIKLLRDKIDEINGVNIAPRKTSVNFAMPGAAQYSDCTINGQSALVPEMNRIEQS